MVAGPLYDAADQDLEIQSAQNDGTDKWNLIDINYQYHVAIRHYCDFGYVDRFFNVSSDIEDYQEVCSAILSELFNVKVSYSVELFESSADLCAYDYSSVTSCATHKTHERLRNDIIFQYGEGNTTTARVIWTGHLLESAISNFNDGNNTIVITINEVTNKALNYSNKSDYSIYVQRLHTLLHETSHHLGAGDHYCPNILSGGNCNNPRETCYRCDLKLAQKPTCVMSDERFFAELEAKLISGDLSGIYCNNCMSDTESYGIVKHLNDYH